MKFIRFGGKRAPESETAMMLLLTRGEAMTLERVLAGGAREGAGTKKFIQVALFAIAKGMS